MSSHSSQLPSDAKPLVQLENWSLVVPGAWYEPPERQRARVQGIPTDHPSLGSGREIVTSSIVRVDADNDIVETHNTRYHLGEVNPNYEVAYPDAKARLFGSI